MDQESEEGVLGGAQQTGVTVDKKSNKKNTIKDQVSNTQRGK